VSPGRGHELIASDGSRKSVPFCSNASICVGSPVTSERKARRLQCCSGTCTNGADGARGTPSGTRRSTLPLDPVQVVRSGAEAARLPSQGFEGSSVSSAVVVRHTSRVGSLWGGVPAESYALGRLLLGRMSEFR
jgi:hypothetical protein